MPETLLSEKNPLLKEVRRAVSRGALTDEGFAIAEGIHLLDDALDSGLEIAVVIASESAQSHIAERYAKLESIRLVTVPDSLFSGLSSTEHPQGVITLVRPALASLDSLFNDESLIVVLDGVQDPGNAGAVVRSAEAFGATGVVFLKGTVNPYNPKCLRGSAGSIFRVPIVSGIDADSLLQAAHRAQCDVVTAMPRAERTLEEADLTHSIAIVIGGEGSGVTDALAARVQGLRIPTQGVESLNAAVACGVLLYEVQRQRSGDI